ncbi:MAG TPA: phosphate acyltransferase, partial [Candidatus Eisenbacteria bacterium]|nr:phosphate acyltransferase [Candidatus Eisenbacteria bacterium]
YKLMQRLGGAETIGPILAGLAKPVHILSRASDDNEIIHIASIAVVEAQHGSPKPEPAPKPKARVEELV